MVLLSPLILKSQVSLGPKMPLTGPQFLPRSMFISSISFALHLYGNRDWKVCSLIHPQIWKGNGTFLIQHILALGCKIPISQAGAPCSWSSCRMNLHQMTRLRFLHHLPGTPRQLKGTMNPRRKERGNDPLLMKSPQFAYWFHGRPFSFSL